MLDQGISFRTLLAWATGTAAVLALLFAWLVSSDDSGRAGIVLMALACTQWILQDNARTRRCVRAGLRLHDEHVGVPRIP